MLVSKGTSGVTARYPHPLAVPERPGLRDDGAEDGDDAEEDEGAVYGGALPCLAVEIGFHLKIVSSPPCDIPSLQAQTKDIHFNGRV